MKKSQAVNQFDKGLITDLNPVVTPNNVLTNALNATLITMNGNEFVLLNDMGNGRVETAQLPTGYVPVGVKEYGGIIYVASYNPVTGLSQLGSFPSPERNLTQDEISLKNISISNSDFSDSNGIKYYYKRIDVMPEDMYLNPGDKFGLFINGTGKEYLSYFDTSYSRAITLHPAILDDFGMINYIDEECKTNGQYDKGLIFGESIDIHSVDGYKKAFSKLIVYKGKKSGRLILIVELETLDDFIVSKSVATITPADNKPSSSPVPYSDNIPENEKDDQATYQVTFYNSGWPKIDNEFINFTGVTFESNKGNFSFTANADTILYTLGSFKKNKNNPEEALLKYKITPYTLLGACNALARTGIINFNLFGTGNIIFNEWRYYVDNSSIRINYGFDLNLLEGITVKDLTFQFYDVYYDKLYPEIYTCKSTINGIYSGNYSETFKFNYDLNYTETYDSSLSNRDYIYKEIIEKDKLKANELIKNNLYCVKIKFTTTGYTGDKKEQTKTFYRFLWTTGYFNEEYIKGTANNFSVLQVPEKYIPKFKLKAVVDKNDNSKFKVNYKNAPRTNGSTTPYKYSFEQSTTKEDIKANLYQNWELEKAEITITTEIDAPKDNSLFGDYNKGWFTLNTVSSSDIVITYDNSKQAFTYPSGLPSTEALKYVSLIKNESRDEDEPLEEYTEMKKDLYGDSATKDPKCLYDDTYKNTLTAALRDGKISRSLYDDYLLGLEAVCDKQYYYIPENSGIKSEASSSGNDPIITFSSIQGLLIRRLSGDVTDSTLKLVTINELRPCYYPGMPEDEARNMIAGSSYDIGNSTYTSGGYVILAGGDNKGEENVFAYWGLAETYVDKATELQNVKDAVGSDKVLNYEVIRKQLKDLVGEYPIYLILGSNFEDVPKKNYGSLGIGFYKDVNENDTPYNPSFRNTVKDKLHTFKSLGKGGGTVTIVLWRTNQSSDGDVHFAGINLGTWGYNDSYKNCVENCLPQLLKVIHILQKNINRELYTLELQRMLYHSVFNTKINIGIEYKENTIVIPENSSPIMLYSKQAFNKETVASNIKEIWGETEDKKCIIETDVWYKDAEATGEPTVMQCSYLNIPYGFITKVSDDNIEERDKVTIDTSELISYTDKNGEAKQLLGISVELGGQIDVSTIVDTYNNYLSGGYKPTFALVADGTSTKLVEALDSLGNNFSDKKVYYSDTEGVYIPGDSATQLKELKIFGEKTHCDLENLFYPLKLNNYYVPVLNANKTHTKFHFSTNLVDDHNNKHVSDILMYADVEFAPSNYKPLTKWRLYPEN